MSKSKPRKALLFLAFAQSERRNRLLLGRDNAVSLFLCLQAEQQSLSSSLVSTRWQLQQDITQKNFLQSELSAYKLDQAQLEQNKASITSRLNELSVILSRPEPPARYERRCIHGHLNCPNLPNNQLRFVNEDEIKAYRQAKLQAEEEQRRLKNNLNTVEDELYRLAFDISCKENQLQQLDDELTSLQQQINEMEEKLRDNQRITQICQYNLESYTLDLAVARANLPTLEQNVANISKKLQDAQLMLTNVQQRLAEASIIAPYPTGMPETSSPISFTSQPVVNKSPDAMPLASDLASSRFNPALVNPAQNIIGEVREEWGQAQKLAENTLQQLGQAAQDAQEFIQKGMNTVSSLWPNPASITTEIIMNRAEEVAGMKPLSLPPNYILDEVQRNPAP